MLGCASHNFVFYFGMCFAKCSGNIFLKIWHFLPETNIATKKWWVGDCFPFGSAPIFYVSLGQGMPFCGTYFFVKWVKTWNYPKDLRKLDMVNCNRRWYLFGPEKVGYNHLCRKPRWLCTFKKSWKLGTKMFEAKIHFPRKVWRPRSVGYVLFLPVSQRFQHRNGWFGRGSSKDPNIFFHQNIEWNPLEKDLEERTLHYLSLIQGFFGGFFGARLLHWVGLRPQKLWPLSPAHPAHAGFSQALPAPERAFKREEHLLSQIHNHLLAKHQKHQGNGRFFGVALCCNFLLVCIFVSERGVMGFCRCWMCELQSSVKKVEVRWHGEKSLYSKISHPNFFSAKKVYFASEVKPPTVKPPT